jgi:hypothetical protein
LFDSASLAWQADPDLTIELSRDELHALAGSATENSANTAQPRQGVSHKQLSARHPFMASLAAL